MKLKITLQKLNHYLSILSGFVIFFVILLMTAEVLMRYLFRAPIEWEIDIVEFCLVGAVFLAASYTLSLEAHVRVDIFLTYMRPRMRNIFLIVGHSIGLVFLLFLTYYALQESIRSYNLQEMTHGIFALPLFPVKFVIFLGSFLLCGQAISQILVYLSQIQGDQTV